MTDSGTALYRRYLQGDDTALESLVGMYSDALVRFAYGYVGDAAAAEDVMADTFAALIVARKEFREEAKFKTYLYRIARNKAIDFLRANKRRLPLREERARAPSAEEEVFLRERERQLFARIRALPEQYAEVLRLYYFEGFSAEQMCRVLKKSKKQVYNLLARARLTLRQIFSKEGISYEDL